MTYSLYTRHLGQCLRNGHSMFLTTVSLTFLFFHICMTQFMLNFMTQFSYICMTQLYGSIMDFMLGALLDNTKA